ncbi:maleylpyruvate isomerase N-terminal domain-containing protein [Parasphingorhabdus pacifica]
MIDHDRMLDLLGTEGQLLTAATLDARPDALVAGASGRTLGATVRHIGDLCEDTLSWMDASDVASGNRELPHEPSLRELTHRFAARLADLLAEFGTRPPDDSCRTWWPGDHSVGFWVRRMVHATTLHRVDVQTAAGVEMTPIEGAIAVDGIDEVLRTWFTHRLGSMDIGSSRPFSVEIRSAGETWWVRADPDRVEAESDVREPGSDPGTRRGGDALIHGDPVSIYLWLWGRLPDRVIETEGDPDAVAQLWGLLQLATR